jgi:hypothetical protein
MLLDSDALFINLSKGTFEITTFNYVLEYGENLKKTVKSEGKNKAIENKIHFDEIAIIMKLPLTKDQSSLLNAYDLNPLILMEMKNSTTK